MKKPAGPTVIVLAAGPDPPADFVHPQGAIVIAADGGAELGVPVELAVGDFDSITAETLATVARVEHHPADKDATDLELALDAALRLLPERILVVGSASGRLDHLLGSLLLLAVERLGAVQVDARLGTATVHVVRGKRVLAGKPGELISLFAMHGPAEGVVARGLLYPLQGETLEPGSSRGTSNVFVATEAHISVARGVLLVVRPNSA